MSDPPKRERRWFQFSLRSLLIGVTLVAVVSWLARIERDRLARKHEQEVRQAKVAAEIARYEFLKTKEADDKLPGAILPQEMQHHLRALKAAGARVAKLESENDR